MANHHTLAPARGTCGEEHIGSVRGQRRRQALTSQSIQCGRRDSGLQGHTGLAGHMRSQISDDETLILRARQEYHLAGITTTGKPVGLQLHILSQFRIGKPPGATADGRFVRCSLSMGEQAILNHCHVLCLSP